MYKRTKKILLQVVFIIIVVGAAFYAGSIAERSEELKDFVLKFGYAGIFILSIISGINLAVPIPIIAFLPLFQESGLDFTITIIIISLGLTLGDLIGYAVGNTGRKIIAAKKQMPRFIEWFGDYCKKHKYGPMVILFLFASFVPFPNEVLVLPLGLIGYRLKYIFPVILAGNIVFNTLYGLGTSEIFAFFTSFLSSF